MNSIIIYNSLSYFFTILELFVIAYFLCSMFPILRGLRGLCAIVIAPLLSLARYMCRHSIFNIRGADLSIMIAFLLIYSAKMLMTYLYIQ